MRAALAEMVAPKKRKRLERTFSGISRTAFHHMVPNLALTMTLRNGRSLQEFRWAVSITNCLACISARSMQRVRELQLFWKSFQAFALLGQVRITSSLAIKASACNCGSMCWDSWLISSQAARHLTRNLIKVLWPSGG